jgi:phage terminase large subunit-like protein
VARGSRPKLRAGLLEAADSRRLLAFALWALQRRLLAAVEAGPRIHVWALGRRSGKTTLAALVCLWDALLRPELDAMVRPGETRYAVAVATNIAQARLLIAAARSVVEASPGLAPLVAAATEDELRFELPSGAKTAIRAFPCSSRGGRGWPISTLVMDEAAHFISETDGYQTADRVFEALVPATAQFGAEARVILASTPYGTEGLFARLYRQAESGELADARAHHASTAEVNPTVSAEFLATEEARDPDAFRQEYAAEFTGSGDAYLDFERFELAPRGELPVDACPKWVAGLDPAFSNDPFGVAIVGRSRENPRRLVLGAVKAWRPPRRKAGSFEEKAAIQEEVMAGISEFLADYGVRVASTDQYAARPVLDRLSRDGIAARQLTMNATTKTAIFAELRARLYGGELEVYEHPDLIAELRRLRTKFTAGQAAVINPRVGGSHGDLAQALAMAVYALRGSGSGSRRKARRGGITRTVLGDDLRPLGEL